MLEIWKDISGYEGKYKISNYGRLKSLIGNRGQYRELILKNRPNNNGYIKCELWCKGKVKNTFNHRLVAGAFIPNPEGKPFVNHKDSNPSNNHVSNLEWCTQSENIQHGYKHGNIKPTRHRLGKRTGDIEFSLIYFEKSRNRWVASVEFLNQAGRKAGTKTFAVKKYGFEEAKNLAAQAVNEILDSIGDTERPRNIVQVKKEK